MKIVAEDRPVAFFGFSLGAILAYEAVRYLEFRHGIRSSHLVSLCGVSYNTLQNWYQLNTAEPRFANFQKYMQMNFGFFPPQFEKIIGSFDEATLSLFLEVHSRGKYPLAIICTLVLFEKSTCFSMFSTIFHRFQND